MKNISVIGGGDHGNGIAYVFAQSGYQVAMFDVSEDALKRAVDTISKNLDRMVAKFERSVQARKAPQRIRTFTSCGKVLPVQTSWLKPQQRTSTSQDLPRHGPVRSCRRDPGHQHLVDFHHADGGADEATRKK